MQTQWQGRPSGLREVHREDLVSSINIIITLKKVIIVIVLIIMILMINKVMIIMINMINIPRTRHPVQVVHSTAVVDFQLLAEERLNKAEKAAHY